MPHKELLMKLGAARSQYPSGWRLVQVKLPPKDGRHEVGKESDFIEAKMKRQVVKMAYTEEFREAAGRQVIQGKRRIRQVALSLEMSEKTLSNWVRRARRGEAPIKSSSAREPKHEQQLELARLRAEVARLKLDNEILKKAAAYFARESR
jgi:transposase